ncbi:MAG: hypothetical protein ACE5PO_08590 [Candidatus Bathyarchaeia archaeon]
MTENYVEGARMDRELFAIYGLAISYPELWDVTVGRKLDRFEGGVIFRSPEKDILISFAWSLPDVVEEGETPSLEEGMNRTLQEISRARGVKKVNVLEENKLKVNDHECILKSVDVTVATGALLRGTFAQRRGMLAHLYCDKTERYLILYGVPSDKAEEQTEIFNEMLKSLACHEKEASKLGES